MSSFVALWAASRSIRRAAAGSSVATLPTGPEVPTAVQVEFTSRCNLRCRMCPLTTGSSSSSGSPGPMRDIVFDELLRIARRCGHVVLAGYGEPLTNPQCIPMLRALDAEGINVSMSTNGLALTPRIARELARLEHLTLINVSIDSPDPDVYRAVRDGDVDRVLRGLRTLMAVIDDPQRVVVASIAMQSTVATLVAFPALLHEIGVTRYSLQAVVDYNDHSREQSLIAHAEITEVLREIEAGCAQFGIELVLSRPDRSWIELTDEKGARERFYGFGAWDERLTRQCHVPWEIPFVDKDGRVFACCFAAAANERQLGQIGPRTFHDIWTGDELRTFRQDILDGRSTPEICRRCTVAPLGHHAFQLWAATIASTAVVVSESSTATVSVSVINQSARSWTPDDHVRIGTGGPRDSESGLSHLDWLSSTRPATFIEATVPPGGTATFEFPVRVAVRAVVAEFEIVVDGTCWLENTRFAVTVGARGTALRARLAALIERSAATRHAIMATWPQVGRTVAIVARARRRKIS